jgi:hypothetical protein
MQRDMYIGFRMRREAIANYPSAINEFLQPASALSS